MLDSATLALRIRDAMDKHEPQKITSAQLAEAFGVSVQAIHSWRKKGRISKGRLLKLARLTGKPARYFLGEDLDANLETQAFKLMDDWLSLKNANHRAAVREVLDSYLDLVEKHPELETTMPDETVARHIAPAGKPVSRKRA